MNKPVDGENKFSFIQDNLETNEFLTTRAAFTSEEIFRQEQEKIFSKTWQYLGHASEIRNVNDYFTRKVAGRKLICVRGEDNTIRAFYNTCTHRGALVCREKTGNSKHFTCGYHGWTFNAKGEHIDQPGTSGYPDNFFSTGEKDLFQVPKLDIYRDFIFINYDRDAVDLMTYLGRGKEIIDWADDTGPNGMEVISGTQEYCMKANWKLLSENSVDGYHGVPTHSTYFDYMIQTKQNLRPDFKLGTADYHSIDLGNGHVMFHVEAPWARPVAQWCPRRGEEGKAKTAAVRQELDDRLGKERGHKIGELNRNMEIFPNLVVNDAMALTIRSIEPVSPGYTEIRAWALAPIGEEESIRIHRLYDFIDFLGPGGLATPDDIEMLELCQQGYEGMEEVEWNDISKGMNKKEPAVDDEMQMRAWWREWNRRMTS